ncbi:MAG TPA: S1 RNA-binding domain-containing protein [Verrucomicrobiae bacterium]|nr:S1 RNA-binding domain-containing protein [Verrucomicrobiae bacterium]
MTEEQQERLVPSEAIASSADETTDRAAAAIAVADEPATADPVATTAPDDASPTEDDAPAAEGSATEEAEPVAAVADEAGAADPVVTEAPAAEVESDAADRTDDAPEASAESAISADEMADAPAAEEDDAADLVPAPRDLGPEPTTMEELLAEQDSDIKSFKHGDVVEGTVVRIDKDEILVDIGAKSEGVVSNRELYGRHAESQPQLAIGDTVLVYVLQPESQEGHAVLSLRRAGLERKWRSMQEQFEAASSSRPRSSTTTRAA